MAKIDSITIEVEVQVSEETAEQCRRILEIYSSQTGLVLLHRKKMEQLTECFALSVEYYWQEYEDAKPGKTEALFERDAAKPVLVAENRAKCPVCKNDELYGQEEDWHYPFCPICGQRLKWWFGAIEAARGDKVTSATNDEPCGEADKGD